MGVLRAHRDNATMRATAPTRRCLLGLVAALVASPAFADDRTLDHARTAVSWAATAAFAARGWLAGSLPRVHAARTIRTAADQLGDVARDLARDRARHPGTTAPAIDAPAVEAEVRRLAHAVDAGDHAAAREHASAIERETARIGRP